MAFADNNHHWHMLIIKAIGQFSFPLYFSVNIDISLSFKALQVQRENYNPDLNNNYASLKAVVLLHDRWSQSFFYFLRIN
jgi:hypothetical protein